MFVPGYLSELARVRLYPVVGVLVLQFMHMPPTLVVWNAACVASQAVLSVLCELGASTKLSVHAMQSSPYMPYTVQHLASWLKEVPQAGLSVLVKDTKQHA